MLLSGPFASNVTLSMRLCAVLQHSAKSPTHLANEVVDRVLYKLQELGRVSPAYLLSQSRRPVAWMVSTTTDTPVGREAEVQQVLESLKQHGAAVVWGGPGEGKTTIAMEAAKQLRGQELELSAFELDMQGGRISCGCFAALHVAVRIFSCGPTSCRP